MWREGGRGENGRDKERDDGKRHFPCRLHTSLSRDPKVAVSKLTSRVCWGGLDTCSSVHSI